MVVDLGTRHLTPHSAAARARAFDLVAAGRRGHKIDSLLRGNWATELVARASSSPVLLIPALPSAGRVCIDGVVRQRGGAGDGDGIPVAAAAGGDPRGGPDGSRPAVLLQSAGGVRISELASRPGLANWLAMAQAGDIAVADAVTAEDVAELGRAVAGRSDVLLAGPAEALAIGFCPECPPSPGAFVPPVGSAPVVVVCGSLHLTARRQLAVLATERLDVVQIVTPMRYSSEPVRPGAAGDAARRLAAEVRRTVEKQPPGAVVILGGDTAAAVLGDAMLVVEGLAAPGTPVARRPDGSGPWIVTRSGSFGDDHALVDLVTILESGDAPAGEWQADVR